MTTDEILRGDLFKSLNNEEQTELASLLQTADLAKFAKATPLGSENELNLKLVEEFVEKTKHTEPEIETEPQKETTDAE
jgi:hypothetical protein